MSEEEFKEVEKVTLVWEEDDGYEETEEHVKGEQKITGGTLKQKWELKEIRVEE